MPGFVNMVDKSDGNIRFELYFEPSEPFVGDVVSHIQKSITSYSPKLDIKMSLYVYWSFGWESNTREMDIIVKPNAMYAALMLVKSIPRTIKESAIE